MMHRSAIFVVPLPSATATVISATTAETLWDAHKSKVVLAKYLRNEQKKNKCHFNNFMASWRNRQTRAFPKRLTIRSCGFDSGWRSRSRPKVEFNINIIV